MIELRIKKKNGTQAGLLSFIIMMLFVSCKNDLKSIYGIRYNNEREKVGLIPLRESWEQLPERNNIIWWHPQNLDSLKKGSKAFYGAKMIRLENDTLMYESDVFVIYNHLDTIDVDPYYMLSCIYYFHEYDETIPAGWTYSIREKTGKNKEMGTLYSSKDISKREADSILLSWDLGFYRR